MKLLRDVTILSGVTVSLVIQADVVHLNNGDQISGTIIEMGANTISIETSYYDKNIEINWKDISTLETEEEVTIMKSDSTRAKGKIESINDGVVTLSGSSSSTFSLNDISKINPVPEGTYVGAGVFHFGGFLSQGNTEKHSIHADAKYIYRNEVNRFTLGGTYDVAKDGNSESANNLRFFGKYDRFLDANWYVYANADFTKDRFQDLDYRITGGAGLGYQFWDDSEKFLSFEAGPGYTYEVYTSEKNVNLVAGSFQNDNNIIINPNSVRQIGSNSYSYDVTDTRNYANARWAVDFHHWFIDEFIQLFHNHEGIISLQEFSDVLVRTHTGIKVPVFRSFDVIAQFDYDWKNIPAVGNDREDFRYILGVGYAW